MIQYILEEFVGNKAEGRMFVFRKIWRALPLETPVLRFALLPYYRRIVKGELDLASYVTKGELKKAQAHLQIVL